jgi:radical SAM enzyme (TIGR01210 family)
MNELAVKISSIRKKQRKPKNPRDYVSFWVEKDRLDENVVDAFVMILRTGGCSWAHNSGCSMCGYINDALQDDVKEEDLLYQYENVMKNYSQEKIVKIFTSGSFLNEKEVPKSVQEKIFDDLEKKTDKIIIESRPEFVTAGNVKGKKKLEVAVGLESASDFISKNSINKGFTFSDYLKAVKILKEQKIKIKTYLLIKPPFLSEKEAISDAIYSAEKISGHSPTISFNPVNIQKFTLVERLWRGGEYRPPWLWSVVEVLKQSSKLNGTRVMSSPTAGGTKRGAHNCGICDKEVLLAIEEFSQSQDVSVLEDLKCDCKELWQDILKTENIAKAQGDLSRLV